MRKKYGVLFVFPGPIWDLPDHFAYRLERLSASFEGMVYTATSKPTSVQFGAFQLETIGVSARLGRSSALSFIWGLVHIARRERKAGRKLDLVVSYDPLLAGMAAWFAARILGAPMVCEVNGDSWDPLNYIDIKKPVLAWIKRHLYTTISRFILRRVDGVRFLYPGQANYCHLKPGTEVIVLYDFTDVRGFCNLGEEKRILFAGFPFWRKGVDVLVKAFKRVAAKHPDWELRILGWYPDRTDLDRHIDGHPQIHCHPPVKHRDMVEQVGKAAIVVLPSRSEAMGRILLEAKAAGKPAVGTKVGGIPYVIESGGDGFLFSLEDDQELAAHLDSLMASEELRRRLGSRAKERAETEFTMDRYFESIGGFYRRVIEKVQSRSSGSIGT